MGWPPPNDVLPEAILSVWFWLCSDDSVYRLTLLYQIVISIQ